MMFRASAGSRICKQLEILPLICQNKFKTRFGKKL
jgi:hypothetical protein